MIHKGTAEAQCLQVQITHRYKKKIRYITSHISERRVVRLKLGYNFFSWVQ